MTVEGSGLGSRPDGHPRATLRSAEHQAELTERGFVVVPFGGPDRMHGLRAAVDAIG